MTSITDLPEQQQGEGGLVPVLEYHYLIRRIQASVEGVLMKLVEKHFLAEEIMVELGMVAW